MIDKWRHDDIAGRKWREDRGVNRPLTRLVIKQLVSSFLDLLTIGTFQLHKQSFASLWELLFPLNMSVPSQCDL